MITGIIFFGARLYMQEISEEPSIGNSNSSALVLLNTRMLGDYVSVKEMTKPKAEMPWGNRFTFLHIPIPKEAEVSNPLDFVLHSRKVIKMKRKSLLVYLTSWSMEIMKTLRGPNVSYLLIIIHYFYLLYR